MWKTVDDQVAEAEKMGITAVKFGNDKKKYLLAIASPYLQGCNVVIKVCGDTV